MKFNLDLGEILTKFGKSPGNLKVLWIFGILSGCVASNRVILISTVATAG